MRAIRVSVAWVACLRGWRGRRASVACMGVLAGVAWMVRLRWWRSSVGGMGGVLTWVTWLAASMGDLSAWVTWVVYVFCVYVCFITIWCNIALYKNIV